MSLQLAAQHMASRGRGPDTQLVHMAPQEVAGLQALARAHGGSLTTNPDTGLAEAGFLKKLLPTLIGAGLMYASGGTLSPLMAAGITGAGYGVATGSLSKGIMAGMGAYGGAGLAGGLMGAGTGAISAGVGADVASAAANTGEAAQLAANVGNPAQMLSGAPAEAFTSAVPPPAALPSNLATLDTAQFADIGTATPMPAPAPMSDPTIVSEATQERLLADRLARATPGDTLQAGFGKLKDDPKSFLTKDNLKFAGAALSPMLMSDPQNTGERKKDEPYEYAYDPGRVADPQLGYEGAYTGERTYFNPRFTRKAGGGLMDLGTVQAMSDNNMAETMRANGGQRFAAGGQIQMQGTFKTDGQGGGGGPMGGSGISLLQNGGGGGNGLAAPTQVAQPGGGGPMGGSGLSPLRNDMSTMGGLAAPTQVAQPIPMGEEEQPNPDQQRQFAAPGQDYRTVTMPQIQERQQAQQAQQQAQMAFQQIQPNFGTNPGIRSGAGSYGRLGGQQQPSNSIGIGNFMRNQTGANLNHGMNPSPTDGLFAKGGRVEDNPYYYMSGASGDAFKYLMGQQDEARIDPILTPPQTAPEMPLGSTVGDEYTYTFDPVAGTYTPVEGGAVAAPAPAQTEDPTIPNPIGGHYGFAKGGLSALAMAQGGYNLGDYSDGGRLLRGPGDGVSDSIPASISDKRPARLADGEFVVPARIVSELGNGSTEAGARKLYAMMSRVQNARKKSIGKDRVAVNSRTEKMLPA